MIPAAEQFDPDLILISAGYDAHVGDPLASCRLETATFAEMARQTRDLADCVQAPVGAVLEGGYQPEVLGECVAETLLGLDGEEPATSAAPEALLTSRAASRVGHFWEL